MTGPTRPSGDALAPVRRRGGPQPATPAGYTDVEIARGQADAVLGALGRMQLRLDVLSREQSESLAKIMAALERVEARLAALEARAPQGAPGDDALFAGVDAAAAAVARAAEPAQAPAPASGDVLRPDS